MTTLQRFNQILFKIAFATAVLILLATLYPVVRSFL
jgi:hypothetical protein